MSVIGVRGMPSKITLPKFVRNMAHVLNSQFEAFDSPYKTSNKTNKKTYYLKLPEILDPFKTINIINNAKFFYPLEAFMPVSDIKVPARTMKIPQGLRKSLQIPPMSSSNKELIQTTHKQIMIEMLSKFTGLYELSKTTNHQLLLILWQVLYKCLEDLQTKTANNSCFGLSRCYRKNYVHCKDFELIRDILFKIQKNKGIDIQEINEKEFCSYNPGNDIENTSILGNETLDAISTKYSDRIVSKIMEHLQNFNKDIRPDNQQDLIRAEVQQHINNMAPCIPTIVRTIIRNKLMARTFSKPFEVLRIYGEPYLPNKDVMNPFLRKYAYISIQRSETIFNLYTIKIPTTNYVNFLKCDGTFLSGARLVIRPLMAKIHLKQLKEINETTQETSIDIQQYCA